MSDKKSCSVCGKQKGLKSYKNTSKTEDGKYPFCKACEFEYKLFNRFDPQWVAHRLWRELVYKAENEQTVGNTTMHMNKSLFELWLWSHKKFQKLYIKYSYERPKDYDFHITILDNKKAVSFDNIDFDLSDGVEEIGQLFDPES